MISDANEAAIDRIVASCNGDMRGALKALLLVNEQLETDDHRAEPADFVALEVRIIPDIRYRGLRLFR